MPEHPHPHPRSGFLWAAAAAWLSAGAFFPGRIRAAGEPAPFAVVELFTSEGCSSCPPADKLLADLAGEADREGGRVFALSFHVDYWNYLGWEDPFSRAEFTRRQQTYARAMGGGSEGRIYTPQMIVNGTREFVGSRTGTARESIAAALARKAVVAVSLAPVEAHGKAWRIHYRITGHQAGDLLNVAWVEQGLSVPVWRGENGGRTLKHENVVRAFGTVRLDATGAGATDLHGPAEARPGKYLLIAYVQRAETLEVLGAAQARPESRP